MQVLRLRTSHSARRTSLMMTIFWVRGREQGQRRRDSGGLEWGLD
jgi:hypothetical protein